MGSQQLDRVRTAYNFFPSSLFLVPYFLWGTFISLMHQMLLLDEYHHIAGGNGQHIRLE